MIISMNNVSFLTVVNNEYVTNAVNTNETHLIQSTKV